MPSETIEAPPGRPTAGGASTVAEFCRDHSISRSTFYNLRKRGTAPRLKYVGAKILVTDEAAAEWRSRLDPPTTAYKQLELPFPPRKATR